MEFCNGEAGAVRRGRGFAFVSVSVTLSYSGTLQHAHVLGARALVEDRDAVFDLVTGLQDAARHRTQGLGVDVDVVGAVVLHCRRRACRRCRGPCRQRTRPWWRTVVVAYRLTGPQRELRGCADALWPENEEI